LPQHRWDQDPPRSKFKTPLLMLGQMYSFKKPENHTPP
jgi:hypothetical protein